MPDTCAAIALRAFSNDAAGSTLTCWDTDTKRGLLDQVFDRLGSNQALAGATCDVLNLALGPVELNLLGLVVELDDCANGPVTLDITATQGGGLLGNLLCSLSNLLNAGAPPTAVQTVLFQIAQILGRLVG